MPGKHGQMTAHDIRHLRVCQKCQGLGDDREMITVGMHGACAFKAIGIEGLLKLPRSEQLKFTLADIGPIAMKRLIDAFAKEERKPRPCIRSKDMTRPAVTKVRAGFYRCGALCIHKGHRWCVYSGPDALPNAMFRTLSDAGWWAQNNQPKSSGAKP